jgi:putative spermidine/putrescine transport system ATP-binding protein
MARLLVEDLRVSYGSVSVLPGLSLAVDQGECIALLGPSGCGKTTTLRAVAGFVRPTAGRIRIGDRDMADCPTHKRNVGLVFQDYALFPHMNVAENVAYGLVRRRVPKAEIARKVTDALAMVRMSGFAERHPAAMSGGQRQRVALARAIVIQPDILLLDEPLGALDRKLRDEMQYEIKTLQARLGLTCIIVTHDQEEALSLASRVALMFDGDIAEIGPPDELYHRPRSARAMDFLGASTMFDAKSVGSADGLCRFSIAGGRTIAAAASTHSGRADVRLGVRPENIVVSSREGNCANRLPGEVQQIVFKGPSADVYVNHAGLAIRAQVSTASIAEDPEVRLGAPVWAGFDPADVRVFAGQEQGGRA